MKGIVKYDESTICLPRQVSCIIVQTIVLYGELWRYIATNLKNTTVLTTKTGAGYYIEYIKAANGGFLC